MDSWRPVTKFWVGSQLYIATTRPTDVEKILTNSLNKSPFYENFNDIMKDTLLTAKVSIWKEHRKMINPSFNSKILNSYHDIFINYSKEMVKFLDDKEGVEQTDFLRVIWEKTFDAALDDTIESKRLLPNLTKLNQTKLITREEILEETSFMMMAASETAAITINTVLTILGIYSDIQERVYQELVSVLPNMENSPIQEELNRLDYLESVVKEILRLVPTIPFIMRYADEDIKCDPYVFPAGSNLIVPLVLLHRDPEVWPDPEKFDPDRFLHDEVGKRHRCSYIPFSFGARNCIGLKFGMMVVKVTVATILRNFEVQTVETLYLIILLRNKPIRRPGTTPMGCRELSGRCGDGGVINSQEPNEDHSVNKSSPASV
ncbi:hypothetical protein Zmor_016009 [Zophobas morio]|uniref:Cytochrome P450 4C1 n=1 Tax=Zophobas morio TaxID=2755281 RepID=A0AA38IHV9_9CUCU|nr:hypothetical protein Zmor_016009 [Zophobas morio]